MNWIKKLIKRYQSIIIYGLCSVAAAVVEIAIGWLLLKFVSGNIVVTNTAAIILSSVVHYLLTQCFVFHQGKSIESVVVYIVSFGIGVLLQDVLIWVMYNLLLTNFAESWRYLISKGVSLVIPFFALYAIRNAMNRLISKKHNRGEERGAEK